MGKIRLVFIKYVAGVVLACMAACGPKSAAPALEPLARQIEDSLRVFRISFVREAVQQGMRAAADSDAYYNYLMYASIMHYYSAQPDSMLACVDRTLGYLRRHPRNRSRSRLLVKCLQTRGAYYAAYRYDLDSLVYYNRLACMEAERGVDAEDIILSYNNLADAYRQQGRLDASTEAYRRAIFIADSVHTPRENYVPLYEGIATAYTALHAFDESKIWWNKSKELWDCMMAREKFNYLNNRGTDYYYQEDYANCKRLLLQLDAFLAGHPGMLWERKYCRINLTDVCLKEGDTAGADSLLRETAAFFAPMGDASTLSYIRTQQMELAFMKGDRAEVRRLLRDDPLPPDARPDIRLQRFGFLCRFYAGQGSWKEAYEAKEASVALADSLRNERVRMKTADMQLRYDRDTTVLSQQVRINRQQAWLARMCAALFAAMALVFFLLFFVHHRRKKAQLREERMLRRIVGLRMENIRNRITPHFIANVLNNRKITDAIHALLDRGGLILGICNGFQALVKSGLLPYGRLGCVGKESPTLFRNDINRHVSQIVSTRVATVNSPWLSSFEVGELHSVAVSHGEGKFVVSDEMAEELFRNGQVAFQYVDPAGYATLCAPYNPNGSSYAIEGIISRDGHILGKMGHTERYEEGLFKNIAGNKVQEIFANAVNYFKGI